MIDYPVTLPCPLLAGNRMQGGRTFLRSNFEYATRQRQTFCNDYMVKFAFVCDKAQMKEFKDFYYNTLTNGVSVFSADWLIEGIDGVKEFRFASTYSVKALYVDAWEVVAEFQMITKIKDL